MSLSRRRDWSAFLFMASRHYEFLRAMFVSKHWFTLVQQHNLDSSIQVRFSENVLTTVYTVPR